MYVKPMITHLAFTSDTKVNMQVTCKTGQDNSGPTPSDCRTIDPQVSVCTQVVS
jgi:hypothetical protein